MLGVFVGSAALIIILSVFNGFEDLVLSLYNTFTPELRIEPAEGKSFDPKNSYFIDLKKDNRISLVTEVLQENVLIRYGNGQFIGKIKGVSDEYTRNKNLDSSMVQGNFILKEKGKPYAVLGSAVQYNLSVNLNDGLRPLEIYSPKKDVSNSFTPADEFTVKYVYPSGVFESQQDFDDLVILPLYFAREILNEPAKISYLEITLKNPDDTRQIKNELEKKLGKAFLVKSRIEQNALLYRILNSEKWAIYLILTFVLIIAIFNIIGSLTMLVIDKQKDIAILTSLGADKTMIRQIFLFEGMMIAMTGCFFGLITGSIFCWIQMQFGLITMGQESMIVDAYPVSMKFTDYLIVFATVFTISLIAATISSGLSVSRQEKIKEDL